MDEQIGAEAVFEWKFVRVGANQYTHTLILPVSFRDCLPPLSHCKLLSAIARPILKNNPTASLWIQVDAPGLWFPLEIRRGLQDLGYPVAVTRARVNLTLSDFNRLPWIGPHQGGLGRRAAPRPKSFPRSELSCLRILARLRSASCQEIAALAGCSRPTARRALGVLSAKNLVSRKNPERAIRYSPGLESEKYLPWSLTPRGLQETLRSWHVPPGTRSTGRLAPYHGEGYRHRRTSRRWIASLRKALGSSAEIWCGWTEVALGGVHQLPDALVWGRLDGRETLFWLEVERGNCTREDLKRTISHRFHSACTYTRERGVSLVFAVLGRTWVQNTVRLEFTGLGDDIAVIIADWKQFGDLPPIEWGKVRHSDAPARSKIQSDFVRQIMEARKR